MSPPYKYTCRDPACRTCSPQTAEYEALLAHFIKEIETNRALKKHANDKDWALENQTNDFDEVYLSLLQDLHWHQYNLTLMEDKTTNMTLEKSEKRENRMARLQMEEQGARDVLKNAEGRLEKLKNYQGEKLQALKDNSEMMELKIAKSVGITERDNYIIRSMGAVHSRLYRGQDPTMPIMPPPTSFSYDPVNSRIIVNHPSLCKTTIFVPSKCNLESLYFMLGSIARDQGGLSNLWQYVFDIMSTAEAERLSVGEVMTTLVDEVIWYTISIPDDKKREVENVHKNVQEEGSEDTKAQRKEVEAKKEDDVVTNEKEEKGQVIKSSVDMQALVESDDEDGWFMCQMPKDEHDHDKASTTATHASSKSHSPSPTTKYESARTTPDGKIKTRDFATVPTQSVPKVAHAPFPDGQPCQFPSCIPLDTKKPAPHEYTGLGLRGGSGYPRWDDDDYCDDYDPWDDKMWEDEVEHEDDPCQPWARGPQYGVEKDPDDTWPAYSIPGYYEWRPFQDKRPPRW